MVFFPLENMLRIEEEASKFDGIEIEVIKLDNNYLSTYVFGLIYDSSTLCV